MKNEVKLLKALADETRLKIVMLLADGERCACEFVPLTGKAQPTVSLHLKVLSGAGVIVARREGKSIIYRIKDRRAPSIMKLLAARK